MKFKWFGPQVESAIKQKCADNLTPAAKLYEHHLLDAIDTFGPPRSQPGHPPHIDEGDLFQSISIDVSQSQLGARILSTDPASHWMELGVSSANIAPRPAWIPTVWEHADDIAVEMARP